MLTGVNTVYYTGIQALIINYDLKPGKCLFCHYKMNGVHAH